MERENLFEQKANIKFLVRLGKSKREIYEMLKTVYGESAMTRTTVHKFVDKFNDKLKEGLESDEDDEREGRFSTSHLDVGNDETLKKRKHLKDQHRKELMEHPVCRAGTESPPNHASSWQYFPLMSFLQDEVMLAETTGNLDGSELDMLDTESSCSNNTEGSEHEVAESLSPLTSSALSTKTRKRTANSLREDMLMLERKEILLMEKRL